MFAAMTKRGGSDDTFALESDTRSKFHDFTRGENPSCKIISMAAAAARRHASLTCAFRLQMSKFSVYNRKFHPTSGETGSRSALLSRVRQHLPKGLPLTILIVSRFHAHLCQMEDKDENGEAVMRHFSTNWTEWKAHYSAQIERF